MEIDVLHTKNFKRILTATIFPISNIFRYIWNIKIVVKKQKK